MSEKYPKARNLFLIIRGKQSEFHKAPFHQIILCTRKHVAKWEAGDVVKGATVIYNAMGNHEGANWFLAQYKGYGCDCNQYFTLFDGVDSRELTSTENIHKLLKNATWWSYDEMPSWIERLGVKPPTDDFSKKQILDDLGDCLLPISKQGIVQKLEDKYNFPHWLTTN